mmetsp:Transcript_65873/g.189969  ORF Transcript_65873/g.189969 Transcript_65873/m.189969 type:complete len:432 (+) Transcript_65873:3631-4926(+)
MKVETEGYLRGQVVLVGTNLQREVLVGPLHTCLLHVDTQYRGAVVGQGATADDDANIAGHLEGVEACVLQRFVGELQQRARGRVHACGDLFREAPEAAIHAEIRNNALPGHEVRTRGEIGDQVLSSLQRLPERSDARRAGQSGGHTHDCNLRAMVRRRPVQCEAVSADRPVDPIDMRVPVLCRLAVQPVQPVHAVHAVHAVGALLSSDDEAGHGSDRRECEHVRWRDVQLLRELHGRQGMPAGLQERLCAPDGPSEHHRPSARHLALLVSLRRATGQAVHIDRLIHLLLELSLYGHAVPLAGLRVRQIGPRPPQDEVRLWRFLLHVQLRGFEVLCHHDGDNCFLKHKHDAVLDGGALVQHGLQAAQVHAVPTDFHNPIHAAHQEQLAVDPFGAVACVVPDMQRVRSLFEDGGDRWRQVAVGNVQALHHQLL